MTRLLLVVLAAGVLAGTALAGSNTNFPNRIELPDGFRPEGIAISGQQFYVGSIPTGAVYRGNLRTGEGAVFIPGQTGRAATGLELNRGRIFVSGASTGMAFVYDATTGADITTYALSSGGSFINDVVVTSDAAWFTDSLKPVLYRVPLGPGGEPGPASDVETVPLSGEYHHEPDFNVNGIDATANGNTLVIVQSNTGKLFTVTPAGVTEEIVLADSESVPMGDGILLDGRTLYVVQNRLNVVAKTKLAQGLQSGRVVKRISDPGFDVPTTIAERGNHLYAVNARFGPTPTPETTYWITRILK